MDDRLNSQLDTGSGARMVPYVNAANPPLDRDTSPLGAAGGGKIYKLLATHEWAQARATGRYEGSTADRRDGFIHLSGPDQVVETAARHFAQQAGLTLLTVDPDLLGDGLRWEPSRGGALFPHLYGPMPARAVVAARPVPEGVPVDEAVATLIS